MFQIIESLAERPPFLLDQDIKVYVVFLLQPAKPWTHLMNWLFSQACSNFATVGEDDTGCAITVDRTSYSQSSTTQQRTTF